MTRTHHLLAVAAFACAVLWFGYDPAGAADTKPAAAAKGAKKAARKADAAGEKSLTNGKKVDAEALAKIIDQQIARSLQTEGVKAAPRSDDAEFLRRVYLDIVGVVPTADQAKAFLDSQEPNKRAKLVDELLANPRFGKQLAEIWTNILIPHDSNNRRLSDGPFIAWLTEHFNKNQPLNELVRDLVAATGNQDENGAVTFYVANPSVDKMTDNVTKMFLGVQLQCAQCHNHPFTDYKQTEYWSVAAFFMKTRLTLAPNQAAKKGIAPGIAETGKGKKQMLPESAKNVPAQFLRGEQPKLIESEPYRPILAKWIASPDNPFFARAMVNRFWYQLFGRGLVTPVDDMHADNAPAHPAVLATLTEQLKLNNFDTKYLVRAICNSDAYQRSTRSATDKSVDPDLYAQRMVRTMSPEQLYDSLATALQSNEGRGEVKNRAAGLKKGPGGARDNFLAFFRVEDPNPLDYQSGIPQALRLMNSPMANNLNAAVKTVASAGPPEQVVERLYLSALARRPSADETRKMLEYAGRQNNSSNAYSDILWALVNSSEFVLNH